MSMLSLVTALSVVAIVNGQEWNYNTSSEFGPVNWGTNYPTCASTQVRQSPINIPSLGRSVKSFPSLEYTNYDAATGHYILLNNGHAAEVEVESVVKVTGAELPGIYRLAQFHFHWGSVDTRGSEHQLDGVPHAMEIHLVHYNEIYPNTSVASASSSTGLAVFGVLVMIGAHNDALDPIVQHLRNITYEGQQVTIDAIAIDSILPTDRSFFRYDGGLTTPGCTEAVVWTVYRSNIEISAAQMAEFRALRTNMETTSAEGMLVDNYRPVQNQNSRTIYESSIATPLTSAQLVTLPFIALIAHLFM